MNNVFIKPDVPYEVRYLKKLLQSPTTRITLSPGDEKAQKWWIDIWDVDNQLIAVIEYRPRQGFGITFTTDPDAKIYGTDVTEVRKNVIEAVEYVKSRFTNTETV